MSGRDSVYGHGNGTILLDDLECLGSESNLFECGKKSGSHDCTHQEDAAVVCGGKAIHILYMLLPSMCEISTALYGYEYISLLCVILSQNFGHISLISHRCFGLVLETMW